MVTAYGLNQLDLDNSMWPLFVTEMHTNPGRLSCAICDTQTTEPVLRNHAIINILLHGCDDKFILLVSRINRLLVIIIYFLPIRCGKIGYCCSNGYWQCVFPEHFTNLLTYKTFQLHKY